MKRIVISALVSAFVCGSALADTKSIEVPVPTNIEDAEVAQAYTTALLKAISSVCQRETSPTIGVALYTYRTCIADTRLAIAKTEPTGLLAARLGTDTSIRLAEQ